MNYCSNCGAEVNLEIPEGDDRARHVCKTCHTIHYQNPRLVAGAIVESSGKILLCRRAIEPQYGKWTIPAGYMENGETVEQCARRETLEEAGAAIEDMRAYSLLNISFINQVYFVYLARLAGKHFSPGAESLAVDFFSPESIPWDELAFRVVRKVLKVYCSDLAQKK